MVDSAVRERVIGEVREALEAHGFQVEGAIESPIKGTSGNIEYLIHAVYGK